MVNSEHGHLYLWGAGVRGELGTKARKVAEPQLVEVPEIANCKQA